MKTIPIAAWSNIARKRVSLASTRATVATRSETSRTVLSPPEIRPSLRRTGTHVASK